MRRENFEIRTNYLFHHDEVVERAYAVNWCPPDPLLASAKMVLSGGRSLDSHTVLPYSGPIPNLGLADLAFLEENLLRPIQTLAGELSPSIVAALHKAARRYDPTFDAGRVTLLARAQAQDDVPVGDGDLRSYEFDRLSLTLSALQEVEILKLDYPVLEVRATCAQKPRPARESLSDLQKRTSTLTLRYIEEVLYRDHYDTLLSQLGQLLV